MDIILPLDRLSASSATKRETNNLSLIRQIASDISTLHKKEILGKVLSNDSNTVRIRTSYGSFILDSNEQLKPGNEVRIKFSQVGNSLQIRIIKCRQGLFQENEKILNQSPQNNVTSSLNVPIRRLKQLNRAEGIKQSNQAKVDRGSISAQQAGKVIDAMALKLNQAKLEELLSLISEGSIEPELEELQKNLDGLRALSQKGQEIGEFRESNDTSYKALLRVIAKPVSSSLENELESIPEYFLGRVEAEGKYPQAMIKSSLGTFIVHNLLKDFRDGDKLLFQLQGLIRKTQAKNSSDTLKGMLEQLTKYLGNAMPPADNGSLPSLSGDKNGINGMYGFLLSIYKKAFIEEESEAEPGANSRLSKLASRILQKTEGTDWLLFTLPVFLPEQKVLCRVFARSEHDDKSYQRRFIIDTATTAFGKIYLDVLYHKGSNEDTCIDIMVKSEKILTLKLTDAINNIFAMLKRELYFSGSIDYKKLMPAEMNMIQELEGKIKQKHYNLWA